MEKNEPATVPEIMIAIGVLFRQLRKPPGIKADDRMEGYVVALNGYPLHAIETAVARILRREVSSIKNPDYCPLPPVMAEIVREIAPNAVPVFTSKGAAPAKKLFAYRPPNAKIIERRCTREWARQLVDTGVHPRGSIWCPGTIGDRPDIGDLYGPDPEWRGAVPWPTPNDKPVEAELTAGAHAPMFGAALRKMYSSTVMPELPLPAPEPRKVPDYSQDKIEASPALLKTMEVRKATDEAARGRPDREGGT